MGLPTVQHWIMAQDSKIVPPLAAWNAYNLLGVAYRLEIPSTIGLSRAEPHGYERLTFFARFFGGSSTQLFEMRFRWLDDPKPNGTRVPDEVYGPYAVFFRPGDSTRDFVFHLKGVQIYGIGRYRVRFYGLSEKRRATLLATEFFEVTQP